jgi:hypothetical protein
MKRDTNLRESRSGPRNRFELRTTPNGASRQANARSTSPRQQPIDNHEESTPRRWHDRDPSIGGSLIIPNRNSRLLATWKIAASILRSASNTDTICRCAKKRQIGPELYSRHHGQCTPVLSVLPAESGGAVESVGRRLLHLSHRDAKILGRKENASHRRGSSLRWLAEFVDRRIVTPSTRLCVPINLEPRNASLTSLTRRTLPCRRGERRNCAPARREGTVRDD